MIPLPWNRAGEGTQRALAFGAAIVLPLLVAAVLGGWVVAGPGVLMLALPVLLVARMGGLVPGLLATAVGAVSPLLHVSEGGSSTEIAWLAGYVLLGVCASALFEG